MNRPADIFIAYATGDLSSVSTLSDQLEELSYSSWYAKSAIRSGHWRTKIEEAIDQAALVIVLVSSRTGGSREVENEYRRAESLGKTILPVFTEECQAPLYLAALHSVFLNRNEGEALDSISTMMIGILEGQRSEERKYLKDASRRFRSAAESYTRLTYEYVSEGITTHHDVYEEIERAIDYLNPSDRPSDQQDELLTNVFSRGGYQDKAQVRIALIGVPGSGKSSTLFRLFSEFATTASEDGDMPIPVFIRLKNFDSSKPFAEFIRDSVKQSLGVLALYYDRLLGQGRLALLLDGLNEIPEENLNDSRFREIIAFIGAHQNISLVISCLSVEYTPERDLGLETFQIARLNPIQVLAMVSKQVPIRADAERIFWSLLGDEKAKDLLESFKLMGGTESQFWTHIGSSPVASNFGWEVWQEVRDNPFSLLELGRNPYLLTIIVKVLQSNVMPKANKFDLFSAFFSVLCQAAKNSLPTNLKWVEPDEQLVALTSLTRAMVTSGRTSLALDRAIAELGNSEAPNLLKLAEREKILEVSNEVTFSHQLLRAYFGSYYVEESWVHRGSLDGFPNSKGWWLSSQWEEAIILLAGKHARDPVRLLTWLRDVQPELVSRCLAESGCLVSEPLLQSLAAAWVSRLQQQSEPAEGRAAIGRALGRISRDARPGVTLCDGQGLPVIEWVPISKSKCMIGNVEGASPTEPFFMSKYLVTNAQFSPFIEDGGYTDRHRDCWSRVGWEWCQLSNRSSPDNYTEIFRISNHPRIGTVWYEVYAYSRWLTKRLRAAGGLASGEEIRLPTEAEWEAASRGPMASRLYPWGDDFDYDRCNVKTIRSTTPVGIYPSGASPEGVHDLVGNAWSWCLTKWSGDALKQDNDPEGDDPRVYRGGSWAFDFNISRWKPEELQCDQRYWIVPLDDRPDAIGFFLVKGACSL